MRYLVPECDGTGGQVQVYRVVASRPSGFLAGSKFAGAGWGSEF